MLPPLTYLSMDAVSGGIGLSQVGRYVERLGQRGMRVTLHSFEDSPPSAEIADRFRAAGVRWQPHRFGAPGAAGGLVRVGRAASALAGSELVHARSDMAAAAALVTRRRRWIWDVRSFWREQRIAAGTMRIGSPYERLMRSVEAAAARSCTGIVTLSQAAIDVLADRYGAGIAAKSRVITTCADLDLFTPVPMVATNPIRLLLAGTLNALYDVPLMLRFVERLQARRRVELTVLASESTPWQTTFSRLGVRPLQVAAEAMPGQIGAHHAGLSVLRDVGVSNAAATPTKLGEFLACGRPVVVNQGLGDMDSLLKAGDCGVVLAGSGDAELDSAAGQLIRLLDDVGTPGRCRALAEQHFSLDRGVDALLDLYHTVTAGGAGGGTGGAWSPEYRRRGARRAPRPEPPGRP